MRGSMRDFASFPDPTIRFKHETLLQEYQDLKKETDARTRKLETMKQKRSILMAEVRFLRRRYKHLTEGALSEMMRSPESGNFRVLNKVSSKRKKQTWTEAELDLNKKSNHTVCKERERMENSTGDLSKKQRKKKGNKASGTPLSSLPDLNQTQSTSKVAIFDLNEIARGEEETQVDGDQTSNSMSGIRNNELQGEIKLSVCRNSKKELNRTMKRKVSWQDPVALRV